MKHLKFIVFLLVGIFIMSACKESKPQEEANKVPDKKDRNMFGHRIPRGLTINTEGIADGYVMFVPPNSASTYLINRKGEVVHEWKGNYTSESVYLMDDGSIVQNAEDPDFAVFAGGGQAGRIQKISWNSKMLWDFEYATDDYLNHHDIAVLPNGNILSIAWEAKSAEDVIAAGRKPEHTPKDGLWPDKIVEIKPIGKRKGEIVWEWHSWDHLIQDYDKTKANYGNLSEHPELLNFNIGWHDDEPKISQDSMDILISKGWVWRNQTVDNQGSDVFHFNAINYNSDLDQIVFSSPSASEIFIIDHSTTSKEAASHTGGKYGKGGDFLFRWGNPKNYNRGDSTDQKLFGQHDVRWIEKGKPGAGNLTVFNNDISGRKDSMNYSSIFELITPLEATGKYTIENGKSFGPDQPTWKYMAQDTISFHSSFISGAHRMHNGNTFINEGARGRFFEVTPEGKIVWEYLNPYRGEIRQTNGEPKSPMPLTYFQFRSTFIPADHPALAGKDLKPLDPQPKPFVLPPPPPKEVKK